MWAEELLMIEKMVTSLQNPSAHISGKLSTYLEKPLPSRRTREEQEKKNAGQTPPFALCKGEPRLSAKEVLKRLSDLTRFDLQ